MARDLRLLYEDEFRPAGLTPPPEPDWVPQIVGAFGGGFQTGAMPVQHLWLKPSGRFGPAGGNKLIYPLIVQAKDVRTVIPYILGWAAMGGQVQGDGRRIFQRGGPKAGFGFESDQSLGALPIADPDGYGMYATDIPSFDYWSFSGRVAMEVYPDNQTPSGVIYNNQILDRYLGGDAPDIVGGFDTNPNSTFLQLRKVIKRYQYVRMGVQFEHVNYRVVGDSGVDFGVTTPELGRFMYTEHIPSMEYVSMERNILKWAEGQDNGNQVARGAGFPRATGEVKVSWNGLPGAAIINLLALMGDSGQNDQSSVSPNINFPGLGCVNDADFTMSVMGRLKTYRKETLLWAPGRTTWKPSPMGDSNFDVELKFLHRPEGWNKFFYFKQRTYFRAQLPDGSNLFPLMPFSFIFELG